MLIKHAHDIAYQQKADKIVLIASRRTDMPRFYIDEIISGLETGIFHPQGLMQPLWELRFQPENIHSISLWSQDYSLWLQKRTHITKHNYHFWYRFTILPDNHLLKPVAPSLDLQLEQLARLAELDGSASVNVCIDPVTLYKSVEQPDWSYNYTEKEITRIFTTLSQLHIPHCTISIIDYYRKVEQRARRFGIIFHYPDSSTPTGQDEIRAMIRPIKSIADSVGIELRSCCEIFLEECGLTVPGACVNGSYLNGLFGPGASEKRDAGQRRKFGCNCTLAVDIGRYTSHGPWSHQCFHDCPQCYARR